MELTISPHSRILKNTQEYSKQARVSPLRSHDSVCFSSNTTLDSLIPNNVQMQEMQQRLNDLLHGKGKTKALYLGVYGNLRHSPTEPRNRTNDRIGLSWRASSWIFDTMLYGSISANFKLVEQTHTKTEARTGLASLLGPKKTTYTTSHVQFTPYSSETLTEVQDKVGEPIGVICTKAIVNGKLVGSEGILLPTNQPINIKLCNDGYKTELNFTLNSPSPV